MNPTDQYNSLMLPPPARRKITYTFSADFRITVKRLRSRRIAKKIPPYALPIRATSLAAGFSLTLTAIETTAILSNGSNTTLTPCAYQASPYVLFRSTTQTIASSNAAIAVLPIH